MEKVFLFDGTSLAYRAFFAIKGLSTSKGFPTNAVYGFIRIFLKLYREFKPNYAAVAFDAGRKTFRTEISVDYKANRRPTPDDFKVQLPYIKRFLKCLGIEVLEEPGYEADDIIGTLAEKLSNQNFKVVIVTPDKDMRQLVSENVAVIAVANKTGKSKTYDLETFREEYGIDPHQLPEVFGLSGDSVDNIPGVPGIGEKTALKLIREFGSLENLYENLNRLPEKRRKLLKEFKDQAFMSRELARIKTNVPVEVNPERLKVKPPDEECLKGILTELEMKSIFKELQKLFPNFNLNENVEEGREITLEELENFLSSGDLFSRPEVVIVPNGNAVIIATPKGYCEVPKDKAVEIAKSAWKVYTFNAKELYHRLGSLKNVEDIALLYYLKNPLLKNYSAENLLKEYLKTFNLFPLKKYVHHSFGLAEKLEKEVKGLGIEKLYREVELPLSKVLYEMEVRGVLFDRKYLEELGEEVSNKMEELQEKIYEEAGERFNLNSPKQLSWVLFEKLKLKPIKKTKSGYSTDVETLVHLALGGSKIAEYLLEYRKLSKLYGTYIKGILKRIEADGRVRTRFIQTATATGRLSSAEPNLQNLPASDEFSRQIRRAVIPPAGYNLIWADYSQIELRILAHVSEDANLIEAFKSGKDIHSETAKFIFKTENVDEKMRRVAKMVNFGIVYGMSPHGLSERLGIPLEEAREYIENYFKNFPKVKEYIDTTIKEAYVRGYVRTVFGRIRPLPELHSSNKNVRSFGERAAVNATIQGTAADVIKLAMVQLHEKLKEINGFMVLQVHDEIVAEVPEEKTEEAVKLIKETMENCVEFKVPLKVDVKTGKRWE